MCSQPEQFTFSCRKYWESWLIQTSFVWERRRNNKENRVQWYWRKLFVETVFLFSFFFLTWGFPLRTREVGANALCAPIIWNRMKKLEEVPAKSLFWPSTLKNMSLWPGPEKLKGTDATSQYYFEIEGRLGYSHMCSLFCWGKLWNKCCCFDFCLFSAVGKQL